MRVTEPFARTRLDLDTVKRLIDAAAERGVRILSFTGGEPLLLLDDLIECIRHAGRAGIPFIRTGTNGFVFSRPDEQGFADRVARLAERLAATPLRNLWISLDSAVPAIHERMRGFAGLVEGIGRSLPIFHAQGLYPSANLGLNRNLDEATMALPPLAEGGDQAEEERFLRTFRHGLRKMYRQILDLGFTMTSACYPMSLTPADSASGLQAVYAATAMDGVVRFSDREKGLLYQALAGTVAEFRDRLRVITPLSSLRTLASQYGEGPDHSHPCRGGIDHFFVDCRDGLAYPCGYRGLEPLGRLGEGAFRPLDRHAECRRCDWECFRDPSELFGPALLGLSRPLAFLRARRHDPEGLRLWRRDLSYARACDFFDGRRPPDPARLHPFAVASSRQEDTIPLQRDYPHVASNLQPQAERTNTHFYTDPGC